MFIREREVKGRTDVNYYTARRLGDMAESLNQLARAFDDGIEKNGQLTKDDGLAAMQASAALVCDNCSRCNLYADSEKEDSYYLYYLLRAFEQKGHIDFEDMPQMFQSGCRKKEDYLAQLNRSLGRATMNLSWKNRFLESRDAVISQFRELSVILEEFSHQIDRARDITDEYEYILKNILNAIMLPWQPAVIGVRERAEGSFFNGQDHQRPLHYIQGCGAHHGRGHGWDKVESGQGQPQHYHQAV